MFFRKAPIILACAAAALVAGIVWLLSAPSGPRPPDILLVVWDTCRADRLSTFGHGRPTSPRLDALAARGVRYARCYAPAPWTLPSHASLFTGVLPHDHGLTIGRGDRVRQDLPLLAATLRKAGYQTAGFTANLYLTDPLSGLGEGFDHFQPTYRPDQGGRESKNAVAAVASWLATGRDPDKPLFLFVNLMDTHLGLDPPEEDLVAVRDTDDVAVTDELLQRARRVGGRDALAHLLGVQRVEPAVLQALRTLYDAAVHQVDRNTGDLLDLLARDGALGPDVLTVITSDHGENLGEHGEMDHRMSLYDPLLHIPLVVHRPGHFDGGRTVETQVTLPDVYLTLLQAAGLTPPSGTGIHGRPLPRDGSAGPGPTVVSEFALPRAYKQDFRMGFPGVSESYLDRLDVSILAARDPSHVPPGRKYIRYTRHDSIGAGRVEREELFDTGLDPGEEHNLLATGASEEDKAHARRLEQVLRDAGSLGGER